MFILIFQVLITQDYLSQILKFFEIRDMEHVNNEIYELRKFREQFLERADENKKA